MRKTESYFLNRTGRRASSIGVGGRSFGLDELKELGVSKRTILRFRELIDARRSVNDAMKLAIYETNQPLYRNILSCADSDHITFRSQFRAFLAASRGNC
jgi:hypothetical protein